jgi:hypothetical protein
MPTLLSRPGAAVRLLGAALLLGSTLAAATAQASDVSALSLAGVTGTGIHNTYNDSSTYTYLANALDTGTSLVELDAWANVFTAEWNVSHDNPLGSSSPGSWSSTATPAPGSPTAAPSGTTPTTT